MMGRIAKYILYSTIFLIPVFFLPLTIFPVAFNKQLLLSVFACVLLILWIVKALKERKIVLPLNKLTISLFCFLFILGISTIFSKAPRQSFWGANLEADGFWNFLLCFLVFFLSSSFLTDRKDVFKAVAVLLWSSGVLSILFLLQLFFRILPFDFTQINGWTPLESPYALSLFQVGCLGLGLLLFPALRESGHGILKKLSTILICLLIIINTIVIIIVNYWLAWLGLICFALFFLWAQIALGKLEFRKITLSLFFLLLGTFFLITRFNLNISRPLPLEITPLYKTTLEIGYRTVREGVKNFLLGSGPATFNYQYALYRPPESNMTNFWQVRFDQGRSVVATLFATAGLLGTIGFLLILVTFFVDFIKNTRHKENTPFYIAALYFWLLLFFYPINLTLIFVLFLLMVWPLAISHSFNFKEIFLIGNPFKIFILLILFIVLIISPLFGLWKISQNYLANHFYFQGVRAAGKDLDAGLRLINRAVKLNSEDLYLRNLAEGYLLKSSQIIQDEKMSQEEKSVLLPQLIQSAIDATRAAARRNPIESLNWLELGLVYENIIPLSEGAGELALENYQKAMALDPQNPQIYFQIGRVHFTMSQKFQAVLEALKKEKKPDKAKIGGVQELYDEHFKEAKSALQKSLELKADFQPSLEFLRQLNAS